MRIAKQQLGLWVWAILASGVVANTPSVFEDFLKSGQEIKGATVAMVPPEEVKPFLQKIQNEVSGNESWFREHQKKSGGGAALKYDKKLGLSAEEYEQYVKLWNQKSFKEIAPATLRLEKLKSGKWVIRVTGAANHISLLQYHPKTDSFRSPNGMLERLPDIEAAKESPLGKWSGKEWKFLEKNSFSVTKENLALGQQDGSKYGLIVYRLQEVSSSGRRLYEKSFVIRFALKQ